MVFVEYVDGGMLCIDELIGWGIVVLIDVLGCYMLLDFYVGV